MFAWLFFGLGGSRQVLGSHPNHRAESAEVQHSFDLRRCATQTELLPASWRVAVFASFLGLTEELRRSQFGVFRWGQVRRFGRRSKPLRLGGQFASWGRRWSLAHCMCRAHLLWIRGIRTPLRPRSHWNG